MLEAILSNRTASVLWEALPRILSAGLTMTIPLTLISFSLAMVLAVRLERIVSSIENLPYFDKKKLRSVYYIP